VSAAPSVADAVAVLRRGGLVAFPTETVYGLGCDAENVEALHRLFAVKGRPADHPVIVHLAHPTELAEWGREIPAPAQALADACWPGPLTLVVRRSDRVPDAVTGGRETVGLRVPDQEVALELLAEFGGGIAAPSANRFGRVSPTRAADVRAELGDDVDLVLDGVPCDVGVESTIVDCSVDPPAVLRLGGISVEKIESILARPVVRRLDGEVAAPGALPAHYAPAAEVVLVGAGDAAAHAASLLASGKRVGLLVGEPVPRDLPAGVMVLDPPSDADEYAHVLYARLREADRRALDVVLAIPPPAEGIGAAVRDRLTRAARGSAR
jgi:L-threonylcarbamoyladenylate synthase